MEKFENGFRTNHSFERCELRTLRNTLDEETFLNVVAELLGKKTQEAEELKDRAHLAEGKVLEYVAEYGELSSERY